MMLGVNEETEEIPGVPLKPLVRVTATLALRAFAVVVIMGAFLVTLFTRVEPTGELLGRAMAPLLLGLLIAGLASPGMRRPKADAFINLLLGIATAASVLGAIDDVEGAAKRALAARQAAENSPELQAEIDARLNVTLKHPSKSSDPLQQARDNLAGLRWAEKKSVGGSARFYRIAGDAQERVLQRMPALQQRLALLSQLDLRTFPVGVAHLASQADIADAAAKLRDARAALAESVAIDEVDISRVGDEMGRAGTARDLTQGYLKGRVKASQSSLYAVRATAARLDALTLLERRFGHWKVDPTKGFTFASLDDHAAFKASADNFEGAHP